MNPQMNMNNDRQHLKLLSIFHYIMGGILAFFFLFPLIHFTIGLLIITESISVHSSGNLPPQAAGYFFAVVGGLFFILGEVFAIATIVSGRFLKRRQRYWFSFVMACILCSFTPLGTILGVFTIIVLSRQSVKELYGLPNADTVN
ncbi:hypothetical protein GQR42_06000 [Microcystis aeruginosa FD4]|jgi:hypothetical protein|uniref:Uncharacterized protein n=2 Tax=Microcystis aeruginosa TaxID=1126 RepID=A0A857D213_MICAE|nr:hypothetical protein GQR42_06000 [Microcystis aeruginosa FD4]